MRARRLTALAEQIKPHGSIIDVGCDHGYIAKYIYDNNLAEEIFASDISAGSLEKAKMLLKDTSVRFLLGDGLKPLEGRHVDAAVVAGMGGRLIEKILQGCDIEWLYLLPHRNVSELRRFLSGSYNIVFDRTIEDGKFYSVITAVRGVREYTELELEFGCTNLIEMGSDFLAMLRAEQKKLHGLQQLRFLQSRQVRLEQIQTLLNGGRI